MKRAMITALVAGSLILAGAIQNSGNKNVHGIQNGRLKEPGSARL